MNVGGFYWSWIASILALEEEVDSNKYHLERCFSRDKPKDIFGSFSEHELDPQKILIWFKCKTGKHDCELSPVGCYPVDFTGHGKYQVAIDNQD